MRIMSNDDVAGAGTSLSTNRSGETPAREGMAVPVWLDELLAVVELVRACLQVCTSSATVKGNRAEQLDYGMAAETPVLWTKDDVGFWRPESVI